MGLSVFKYKKWAIRVSAKILKNVQVGFLNRTYITLDAPIRIELVFSPLSPQTAKLFQLCKSYAVCIFNPERKQAEAFEEKELKQRSQKQRYEEEK